MSHPEKKGGGRISVPHEININARSLYPESCVRILLVALTCKTQLQGCKNMEMVLASNELICTCKVTGTLDKVLEKKLTMYVMKCTTHTVLLMMLSESIESQH